MAHAIIGLSAQEVALVEAVRNFAARVELYGRAAPANKGHHAVKLIEEQDAVREALRACGVPL